MHKGLVFYFYAPLRSAYYSIAWDARALSVTGEQAGMSVNAWYAVRPALQLAKFVILSFSEESHKFVGHFTKVQCDTFAFKGKKYYT